MHNYVQRDLGGRLLSMFAGVWCLVSSKNLNRASSGIQVSRETFKKPRGSNPFRKHGNEITGNISVSFRKEPKGPNRKKRKGHSVGSLSKPGFCLFIGWGGRESQFGFDTKHQITNANKPETWIMLASFRHSNHWIVQVLCYHPEKSRFLLQFPC